MPGHDEGREEWPECSRDVTKCPDAIACEMAGRCLARDAHVAPADPVRAALRLYQQAFDEMFSHCRLSNGIYNRWGKALNCATLNRARKAATRALAEDAHAH